MPPLTPDPAGNEKRWFNRTMAFAIGMGLLFLGSLSFNYLTHRKIAAMRLDAAPSPEQINAAHEAVVQAQKTSFAIGLSLAVLSLVFLFSLVKWMLAVRHRRQLGMSRPEL